MSTRREQDREAYYRFVYRAGETERVPAAMWERAHVHLAQSQARAAAKLAPFVADSALQQRRYLRQQYGETPPRGLGVRQGEYITVGADEVNDDRRMIATDFLMDCHGLILVARDAQGNVQRTLLAHVDSMTDVPTTIPQLLARMPQGSRVEATIIGSTDGYNPYLHGALLDALAREPQVRRIRQNVDLANTIAVDTSNGRIFTASAANERLPSSGRIEQSDIPIDIQFSPVGNTAGIDIRNLMYEAFRHGRPASTLGLADAWNATDGFTPYETTTRFINQLVESDNGLTPDELQSLESRLSTTMRQQIRLMVGPVPVNDTRATIQVQSVDGAQLGQFVSNILPAAPLNTPTQVSVVN